MLFKLKAAVTTKWLKVTDLHDNINATVQQKLSTVTNGVGTEVEFDVIPSDSGTPQRGFVQVDVARNVNNQPSEWATHYPEMLPEVGQIYPIDDTHLPSN